MPAAERRTGRPTTIGALLPKAAGAAFDKRGFAGAQVIARWPAIVGEELAALAVPLEVKFPRGRNAQATLVLQVASGAAATVLQLKAPQVIARVNGFLGQAAVVRIQAQQGPLPQRPRRTPATEPPLTPEDDAEIHRLTAGVASPDIRSSLENLGAAIARRTRGNRSTAVPRPARADART
jgi:hypothetical protein